MSIESNQLKLFFYLAQNEKNIGKRKMRVEKECEMRSHTYIYVLKVVKKLGL